MKRAAEPVLPYAKPEQYGKVVAKARAEGAQGWHERASSALLDLGLRLPSSSLIRRRESASQALQEEGQQRTRHRNYALKHRDERRRYRDGFLKYLRLRQVLKFENIRDERSLQAWVTANPNFRGDAKFTAFSGEHSPSLGQLLSKYHTLGVHMEDDPFIDRGVTWARDLWQQLELRVDGEASSQSDEERQRAVNFNFFVHLYLNAHFGSIVYQERVIEQLSSGDIRILWASHSRRLNPYVLVKKTVGDILNDGKSPYHCRYRPSLIRFNAVAKIITERVATISMDNLDEESSCSSAEPVENMEQVPQTRRLTNLQTLVDTYALHHPSTALDSVGQLQDVHEKILAATCTKSRMLCLSPLRGFGATGYSAKNFYNQLFTMGALPEDDDYSWTKAGPGPRMSYAVQKGLWRKYDPNTGEANPLLKATGLDDEMMRYISEDLRDARELWAGAAHQKAFGRYWSRMSEVDKQLRACDIQSARCEYDKLMTAARCGRGRLRGQPSTKHASLEA